MVDRQQVINLHRVLSVKYALHQNVNSRLRFREETYRDLQEKLRRKRQKEPCIFVIMAHVACQSFRERSLGMRPSNQAWTEMADTQFDEQHWYENFRVTRDTCLRLFSRHFCDINACARERFMSKRPRIARESVYKNVISARYLDYPCRDYFQEVVPAPKNFGHWCHISFGTATFTRGKFGVLYPKMVTTVPKMCHAVSIF